MSSKATLDDSPALKGNAKQQCFECNECGAQEYTMQVSEGDLNWLCCGNCGSNEFHKAVIREGSDK